MSVGDTLYAIAEAGLTVRTSMTEDRLTVYPAERISPDLAAAIKAHKADIIMVLREDEEMLRTGIVQSERQVFEMAREYFDLDKPGGVA